MVGMVATSPARPAAPSTAAADPRDLVAGRLLRASAARSLDPDVEVDWSAPEVPGMFFMPEHLISLYGTPTYAAMTREHRIELSRHEVASIAAAGIWFELVLDQLLLRHIYREDPRSPHVRYALTEVEDEMRHSKMFARLIETLGTPLYGPRPLQRRLGTAVKSAARGADAFVTALIAEEVLDAGQRVLARDESVQPLTRQVCALHVAEEARHVGFARDELSRRMTTMSPARREVSRTFALLASWFISESMVNPAVYASVGIDPRAAVREVRRSPHRQEVEAQLARRLTRFLGEAGLIGGPTAALWRVRGLTTAGLTTAGLTTAGLTTAA